MIIDIHGHYTTAPPELEAYRGSQISQLGTPVKGKLNISDDQIRESIENNQLKLQRERGTDLTIFSPRAASMGHHFGTPLISRYWSETCNELIYRICQLFPKSFIGVCQLRGRAGALRDRVRLRGLQPEPRPLRRLLDGSAHDRPLLVPAVREAGRAGRAGHDPCQRQLQSQFPRHR